MCSVCQFMREFFMLEPFIEKVVVSPEFANLLVLAAGENLRGGDLEEIWGIPVGFNFEIKGWEFVLDEQNESRLIQ